MTCVRCVLPEALGLGRPLFPRPSMSLAAWFTLAVLAALVAALVRSVGRADLVMLSALALLLVGGVLEPAEAFAGFANPAVITIASLFVVAAGVDRTGALGALDRLLEPRSSRVAPAVARLFVPTAIFSGVLNNTPIVAMLIPRVQAWARRRGIPASKLLMPLSTAAIAGGWLTLIGTSTNMVVHGLLLAEGLPGLGFFDLTWIGIPVVILAGVYYATLGHRLLPDHEGEVEVEVRARDYQFDVRVTEEAAAAHETVEDAGLRTLGSVFLAHLQRGGNIVEVEPETLLLPGDVLTFVGDARAHDELVARSGFERAAPPVHDADQPDLPLVEAVVAPGSRLEGRTLKEASFRERYGGVVIAVQRKDAPIRGGLGRVPLQAGDLLLVEGRGAVGARLAARPADFTLVTPLEEPRLVSRRAPIALSLLGVMIGVVVAGLLPLATAAFCAALGMVATGCLRSEGVTRALDATVLLVIAAAFGLGRGVEASGLAALAASGVEQAGALGPVGLLVTLFVVTNLLTEVVSNSAAAALMVPVSVSVATDLGMNPGTLGLVVAVAAGASFLTPIGYQTNLMVMGPGRYRYTDYTRAGLPVSLIVLFVTVAVALLRGV